MLASVNDRTTDVIFIVFYRPGEDDNCGYDRNTRYDSHISRLDRSMYKRPSLHPSQMTGIVASVGVRGLAREIPPSTVSLGGIQHTLSWQMRGASTTRH